MYLEAPDLPSRLGYEAAGTVEAHRYLESNQQNGKIVVKV
jgi:NADPH:quinone reductase-like Zn-dependent oxidoreductase